MSDDDARRPAVDEAADDEAADDRSESATDDAYPSVVDPTDASTGDAADASTGDGIRPPTGEATDDGPGGDGAGDAGGAEEFDRVRDRAIDAIRDGDDAASLYVGLVRADGADEYYFGNDLDGRDLREAAAEQLGMLTRVLADQSAASVDEIAELAAERAAAMELRS